MQLRWSHLAFGWTAFNLKRPAEKLGLIAFLKQPHLKNPKSPNTSVTTTKLFQTLNYISVPGNTHTHPFNGISRVVTA